MQTSNIFEALASPPSKENEDPNLENAGVYSFKEGLQKQPLSDITDKVTNTVQWQDLSAENIKPVPKPLIIENPNAGPSADWDDLAKSTQKNMVNIKVTPKVEEKVHEYESQFPALGEEPEGEKAEKPDAEFNKEVLSPANIVVAQALQDSTTDNVQMETDSLLKTSVNTEYIPSQSLQQSKDSTTFLTESISTEYKQENKTVIIQSTPAAPAKDWKELAPIAHKSDIQVFSTPIMDKKVQVYESLFPALGEEPPATQPQTEFVPDVLNPRSIALSQADLQEKIGGPMAEPKPVELSAEQQKMHKSKIIEAPKIAPAKGWNELASTQPVTYITAPPATEEKVQAYEGHFPALGDKDAKEEPETEFTPEILGSEPPVAKRVPLGHGAAEQKLREREQRQKLDRQFGAGQSDLAPIEEHIEIQDETEGFKGMKQGAKRSSLEHLHEENLMNQSTDLTLSAQRIDLIKEELREAQNQIIERDPLFRAVEADLKNVIGLEKLHLYGDAIKVLKKSLQTLDARFINYQDFDIPEMNKLLYECNVHLAYCYNQIHELRYTIDHARAARQFNPNSTKALYLLGGALIKTGNFVEGYKILRESRRIPILPNADVYQNLVDMELKRHERRAQEVLKLEEDGTIGVNKDPSPVSAVGCFLGTAVASGALSWLLLRNKFEFSESKSWAYSIGAGTIIGGLSLLLMGHGPKSK